MEAVKEKFLEESYLLSIAFGVNEYFYPLLAEEALFSLILFLSN
jgi:hypothetical protein